MKKLMIAAAIVCAAAFAQASSVVWSFGLIEGYGEGGKGWSGEGLSGDVSVQLILGSSLSDGVIGNQIYNDSTVITFSDGYAYPESGLDIEAMVKDTPYYSQLILTKGDSTLTSGIFELTATTAEGEKAYPNYGMGTDSYGFNDATTGSLKDLDTFTEKGGAFANAGWQSVPEPTSGLLLLLGVAGLALRRRRA